MSDTPRTDAAVFTVHDESGKPVADVVIADLGRQLEREVAHWQRMYECAQNANALRDKALDAVDLSKLALAAEYEAGAEELIGDLSGLLRECLELSDNWPGVAYSSDLLLRAKAALLRAKP